MLINVKFLHKRIVEKKNSGNIMLKGDKHSARKTSIFIHHKNKEIHKVERKK